MTIGATVLAATFVLGGGAAAAGALTSGGGPAVAMQPAAATAPASPVPSRTAPAPAKTKYVPVPVAPAPQRTVYVPAAPAPPPASAVTGCGAGLAVGPNTSCAFAVNVQSAYNGQLGSGSGYVYAYSPATGQSYEMWCQQAGSLVTATGGNNALVEFYAG